MTTLASRGFENVEVGDHLPPLTFHVTSLTLVRYAAATWDFHPFHYDKDFVQDFGLPAPFADGQMFGALLARLLMSWAGGDAFVRRLRYRQRAMVFVNETVVISGWVSDKAILDGMPLVSATMSIKKADGSIVIRDAEVQIEMAERLCQALPRNE